MRMTVGAALGVWPPDDLHHCEICDRFRDLALRRLPGLEALPAPWREMWQHRDTLLTCLCLMGPSWGLDRDVACTAFIDEFLKTHAHHRRLTQVPIVPGFRGPIASSGSS
eukprot:5833787-Pyramimonas_sp.AAC.1